MVVFGTAILGAKKNRTPKTRLEYWVPKFETNVARDSKNQVALASLGWKYFIAWECELKELDALVRRIVEFLDD